MSIIAFFILSGFLGISLVYLLKIDLFLEEKMAWGLVLGSVLLTTVSFVFALFFGFTKLIVFASFSIVAFAIGTFSLKYFKNLRHRIIYDIGLFVERIKNGKLTLFLLVFISATVLFGTLWPRVLYQKNQNLMTIGTAGVWGDWAAHSSYISHFLYVDKISLNHPLFIGEKFSYTFMIDFLSAMLRKIGASYISAMIIPGLVFSLAFIVLLYYFIFRITKKESVSALTIWLFLLGSGFGFFYFFQDINGLPIFDIANFLSSSTKEYTNLAVNNIHWTSFINALLLPQRSLTMGMPLGILILTCLLMALENKTDNKLFLLAGTIAAFLPTIHIHSLIAVSIVSFLLIILLSKENAKIIIKRLLYFFSPILILGFWQILILAPATSDKFLRFQFGWMAKRENWFRFWVKNLGFFFLFIPFIFLTLKKRLKLIYLSFLVLFILGNIIIFQPHDYDNIKIMTYWAIMNAGVFAVFLVNLWEKKIFGKILAFVIFPFLIFSSAIDLTHLYLHPGYLLFSKNDIEVAQFVKTETPVNSIFLTSDQHNHPIPALSGRQILMGYRGWLWTYGINYKEREKDVLTMFGGGEKARTLLKKYNVDYVFIGPSERKNFLANESFFDQNYPLLFQQENAKIYTIGN